jgi:DNA polymerase-3 subunit delta'
MGFSQFQPLPQGVALLQRSLERGRLGHAYLLAGDRLETLEALARTLAKTLNCQAPPRQAPNGLPLDCCDSCASCRKIECDLHADVRWLRPESKLRVILVEQIRTLLESVYLKATEGRYKVAVIVGADRLNVQAANAFLKTLEEPPPRSVLLLLTTEPARVLETIVSRCLRLTFGGIGLSHDPEVSRWLRSFGEQAAAAQGGLLARYRLLDEVLGGLAARRAAISQDLTARSPLERYDDVEPALRDRWGEELSAAIEAEYRRQRGELLAAVQWWLRDVWLTTQGLGEGRLGLPDMAATTVAVARRIQPEAAARNLKAIERTQRLLAGTNVQEALTLEVGLLRLQL